MGTVLLIILIIIVALIAWLIGMYNGFVRANNNCEEAYSTMDVYMKKRYDLIPNLVETVKAYAKHEQETLEKITAARTNAMGAQSVEAKAQAEGELAGTLKTLFAVAENYPELKANQNFMELQTQLQTVETDIANARKYYNGTVRNFNNKIQVFPSNFFAGIFGYTKKPMFEVESEEERQNVQVDFNA